MILLVGGCGYIGTAVYRRLRSVPVDIIDIQRRGNPADLPYLRIDYGKITDRFLSRYDTIILLAAHSSVGDAVADQSGAFANNVVAFQRLLELMTDRQRLVYASSSSVYSGFGAFAASENMPDSGNMYDLSKLVDDALAGLSGKRCYGLRFGTVCGPSANIRNDLMLNRMVHTALAEGKVHVANPQVHRPILGINDLTAAITAIVNGDGMPGIYNLASFNATVAELGATVASALDVPLVLGEPTPTYDFEIDTAKFEAEYGFRFRETAGSIVNQLIGGQNGRSE